MFSSYIEWYTEKSSNNYVHVKLDVAETIIYDFLNSESFPQTIHYQGFSNSIIF